MKKLSFTPGDLAGNTELLVSYFGLASESAVPVGKFVIITGDASQTTSVAQATQVERGKYKSALLLHYLSTIAAEAIDATRFSLTSEMTQLVRDFYGPKLCLDAETDPETIHQTIRSLLVGKDISVYLEPLE